MLQIFKYEIPIDDYFEIEMPENAKILSVQMQMEMPHIWALVDPTNFKNFRKFRLAGTGHPINHPVEQLDFIGAFQMHAGSLIFHLFEVKGE
jgi:hypothetical protein